MLNFPSPIFLTDWDIFNLAIQALLQGVNPYTIGTGQFRFFNPVWTLFFLSPFSLFQNKWIAMLAMGLVSIIVFMLVSKKFKIGLLGFLLIALSPMHLYSMAWGNIAWLPWIGVLVSPWLGMLFLATKPQATLVVMLVTVLKQWDRYKLLGVIKTVLPIAIVTLITVGIWGLPTLPDVEANVGNVSLFPYSLVLGIPALIYALVRRDLRWGAFATPFLMPYSCYHGFIGILFPFSGLAMLPVWIISAISAVTLF